MSDPFQKYIDENHEFTRSYYDHHKLQARTPKTKELLRDKLSSKPSTNRISRNNFRITHKSSDNLQDLKTTSPIIKSNVVPQKLIIGRSLFDEQIKTKSHLGPGEYDPPLQRSNSFGYIQRDSPDRAIPSKNIRERIIQFLGPGRYAYQEGQNFLSRHRSLSGRTFGSENLIRCILSKEKQENINLKLTGENYKREVWKKNLGPGVYNIERSESKIDKFRKTLIFPVSLTERSSLVKKQKRNYHVSLVPGPGYYDWEKLVGGKLWQKNRKPKIQFKFVH